MQERHTYTTQAELFSPSFHNEQDTPFSPTALVDALEQRYVQLFEQSAAGGPFTTEQQVISSILHEVYTFSRWSLSPLPGLIYQREEFMRREQATMPADEYSSLDALFVQAIDTYTTDPVERAYFERKQRKGK